MGKFLNQKKIQNESGFTLIEVVLVLFLVSMVFLTVYVLFVSTIKHDTESRYEIIASNLAQEGIEIVRNMRDENVMKNVGSGDVEINAGLENQCNPQFLDNRVSCEPNRFGLTKDRDPERGYVIANSGKDVLFYRECGVKDSPKIGANGKVEGFTIECKVCWKSFVGASGECGIAGTGDGFRSVKADAFFSDWLN